MNKGYEVAGKDAGVKMDKEKDVHGALHEGEVVLAKYVRLAWRWRWPLGLISLAALILTAVSHYRAPGKYEARVLAMPPRNEPGKSLAGQIAGSLGEMGVGLLDIKDPAEWHLDILKSDRALDAVINRFDLMERYGTDSRCSVRRMLADRSFFEMTNGGLLKIRVVEEDPRLAAGMANAFVEVLAEIGYEISSSKAGRERRFLEERVAEVLNDLRRVQAEWRSFQEEHRLIRVDDGLKATATVMGQLEARRIAREVELQVLETVYADGSPEVQTLRAEVERLQSKLQDLAFNGTRNKVHSSDSNGHETQWLFPAINEIPALALEQMELERRLALHSKLYELLSTQLELARITEAREQASIEVVSPATVPDRPLGTGLRNKLIVVAGVIFFAFIVVGSVIFSEPALSRRILNGDK